MMCWFLLLMFVLIPVWVVWLARVVAHRWGAVIQDVLVLGVES